MTSDSGNRTLSPFFAGEGGYSHLLESLLTSKTGFAREFRLAFSEKIVEPHLGVKFDGRPVPTQPEYFVNPKGGKGEAIDLVCLLPEDCIGIEVKVLASSIRKGQVAAQYQGLLEAPDTRGRRVHCLFIHPGMPGRKPPIESSRTGDRAASISWDEVFDCFPSLAGKDDENLTLSALCREAQERYPTLKDRGPMRVRDERLESIEDMIQGAREKFNEFLTQNAGAFESCAWDPTAWRSPRVEMAYGPLVRPDGTKLYGPGLTVRAYLDGPADKVRLEVGFGIEKKGVKKSTQRSFAEKLEFYKRSSPSRLPDTIGSRDITYGGLELTDAFTANYEDDALTIGDKAADDVVAKWLANYATAFLEHLLIKLRSK